MPLPEVLLPAQPGVASDAMPVPPSEQVNVTMTVWLAQVFAVYATRLGDFTALVTATVGGCVSTVIAVEAEAELVARAETVAVIVAVPSVSGLAVTTYV